MIDIPPQSAFDEVAFNAIFDELDKYGLDSDSVTITITEQNAKAIQDFLDNPKHNPYMQKLLELGQSYVEPINRL